MADFTTFSNWSTTVDGRASDHRSKLADVFRGVLRENDGKFLETLDNLLYCKTLTNESLDVDKRDYEYLTHLPEQCKLVSSCEAPIHTHWPPVNKMQPAMDRLSLLPYVRCLSETLVQDRVLAFSCGNTNKSNIVFALRSQLTIIQLLDDLASYDSDSVMAALYVDLLQLQYWVRVVNPDGGVQIKQNTLEARAHWHNSPTETIGQSRTDEIRAFLGELAGYLHKNTYVKTPAQDTLQE